MLMTFTVLLTDGLVRGCDSSVRGPHDSWFGDCGFDFRSGRPLSTGWVAVSIMRPAEAEIMVLPFCL